MMLDQHLSHSLIGHGQMIIMIFNQFQDAFDFRIGKAIRSQKVPCQFHTDLWMTIEVIHAIGIGCFNMGLSNIVQ